MFKIVCMKTEDAGADVLREVCELLRMRLVNFYISIIHLIGEPSELLFKVPEGLTLFAIMLEIFHDKTLATKTEPAVKRKCFRTTKSTERHIIRISDAPTISIGILEGETLPKPPFVRKERLHEG